MLKNNFDIVKDFKKQLSKKIKVNKMIFFGSRARGGFSKESDFDLIVVSKDFEGLKRWRRSPQLYMLWNYDYPVDFICYTPEEFNVRLEGINIVSDAVKTGKAI